MYNNTSTEERTFGTFSTTRQSSILDENDVETKLQLRTAFYYLSQISDVIRNNTRVLETLPAPIYNYDIYNNKQGLLLDTRLRGQISVDHLFSLDPYRIQNSTVMLSISETTLLLSARIDISLRINNNSLSRDTITTLLSTAIDTYNIRDVISYAECLSTYRHKPSSVLTDAAQKWSIVLDAIPLYNPGIENITLELEGVGWHKLSQILDNHVYSAIDKLLPILKAMDSTLTAIDLLT